MTANIILLNDIFTEINDNPSIKKDASATNLRHGWRPLDESEMGNDSDFKKWNFWGRYLGPYTIKQSISNYYPDKKVIVVDYFTKINNFFDYLQNFASKDTEIIGISTTFLKSPLNHYISEFNLWFETHEEVCEWFSQLKKIAPNAKIVIGGHTTDVWFKNHIIDKKKKMPYALEHFIDCVIHGYGEKAIVDYMSGNIPEHAKHYCNNLLFVSDGIKAGDNGTRMLEINWGGYDAVQQGEWLPLEISKGCRFGCKFCMFDKMGTTIKDKTALRNEFLKNYEKFGVTGYTFTDDTINDSMPKIQMMYDVITSLPFKIEWISYCRPDMFNKFPQMLEMMLEMGCRGTFLGIETFNPVAAKIAGKGLHPDKIKDILQWMRDTAGNEIFILTSFIIGLVGETAETLDSTLLWLKNQKIIDKIMFEALYIRPQGYRTGKKLDFNNDAGEFNIRKLQYNPYYWEHDTLNFPQCLEILKKWKEELTKHTFSKANSSMESQQDFWAYPRLRSLGYSHSKSVEFLKTGDISANVYTKNSQWINRYHSMLVEPFRKEVENIK